MYKLSDPVLHVCWGPLRHSSILAISQLRSAHRHCGKCTATCPSNSQLGYILMFLVCNRRVNRERSGLCKMPARIPSGLVQLHRQSIIFTERRFRMSFRVTFLYCSSNEFPAPWPVIHEWKCLSLVPRPHLISSHAWNCFNKGFKNYKLTLVPSKSFPQKLEGKNSALLKLH